jgi:hypothetical protein
MRRSMGEHRLHAAGGGLPAPTRVWSQSRVLPSMNGQTVLMPWRRLLRHRRQLPLVAEMAWIQFPNHRSDKERRMRPAPG